MSRTSVREALRHLESEGLVQYVGQRGPSVSVLSQQDIKNIYELRAALEGLAGELFVSVLVTIKLIYCKPPQTH